MSFAGFGTLRGCGGLRDTGKTDEQNYLFILFRPLITEFRLLAMTLTRKFVG